MTEKTIFIKNYPATFSFTTPDILPERPENKSIDCRVRDNMLHRELEKQGINSPNHAYTDYIVELILKHGNNETWIVGS